LKKHTDGQVIIGAIVLLVILAILIPGLISYIQNEAKWTVKEQRTTRAFQLAESAVERGFQKIIQSTGVWNTLQSGGVLAGYNFDQTYTDLAGGVYEIKIIQGPGTQAATITGVAKDTSNKEIRSVRAIFSNSASNAAIYAEGGITLTSNPGVEWGPVVSPAAITTSQAHPRFYSASNIIGKDLNGPVPPNSDNTQWWSYHSNLPPAPLVDLQAYLSSATAQGHVFSGGNISNGNMTGTYWYNGDVTFKPHNFLVGNLIIMGNFTLQGNAANGAYTADIPPNAWKEYGNDWAYYRTNYDPSAPATFPGINGSYTPGAITEPLDKIVVHGFMYVRDSFSITGGGNCAVHGNLYVGDASSLDGSHVKVYYDDTITIMTKNVSLGRSSWEEVGGCTWAGTHAVCP
jgi:hypothetical protein